MSHNSPSHLVLSYCVTHRLVGNLTVHALEFDARAFVQRSIDALTHGFHKYFQIFAAVDFARFGFEDELCLVESVQREVGKVTGLELMDRHGPLRCHDSPPCCFLCRQTANDEGWHVSMTVICSKAI